MSKLSPEIEQRRSDTDSCCRFARVQAAAEHGAHIVVLQLQAGAPHFVVRSLQAGFNHLGPSEEGIGVLSSRRLPPTTVDQACLGVLTHRAAKSGADGDWLVVDPHPTT